MGFIKNIFKQVYACFFLFRNYADKNTEDILVSIMFFNACCFLVMCRYFYSPYFENPKTFIEPVWFEQFYMHTVKFAHGGFLFLVIVTGKSRGFKFLGKFSLASMWLMWILNEYYIATDDIRNYYFINLCLLVFVIFLVLCLFRITSRS